MQMQDRFHRKLLKNIAVIIKYDRFSTVSEVLCPILMNGKQVSTKNVIVYALFMADADFGKIGRLSIFNKGS